MRRRKIKNGVILEPELTSPELNEFAPLIKDLKFTKQVEDLLQETVNDLLAIYFSNDYDLEHRTMVYDNCVAGIHGFLARKEWQEPQPDDEFALLAETIAKSEKRAYQKRHWPEGSPVSEPLALTGELDKIIGSVAAMNAVTYEVQTDPLARGDDLQIRVAQIALSEVIVQ